MFVLGKTSYPHFRIQFALVLMLITGIVTLSFSRLFAQLATGHDKFLGCAIDVPIPANFDTYWNQLTPGNAGKWGSVEPTRDDYSWSGLDAAFNYALNRNFPFKEHVLIWGQQQPTWINGLDSLEQAQEIEEWIQLVGSSYPEAAMVDVVNEPLLFHGAQPSYKNAMGGNGATGWDWVIWAFEKARQYFPDSTKLILNEYHILNSSYYTTLLLELVDTLQVRGLIDAIGIEGHSFELQNGTLSYMNQNLDRLAATALPVYITEFDVNMADDNDQLLEYQRLFPWLWEHPAVKGITLWGYIEGRMWSATPDAYLARSDGTERPALQWLRSYLAGNGVEELPVIMPANYTLDQNYPNPFNPSTTIRYTMRKSSPVKLIVYNVSGEKVRTMMDGYQNSGEYSLVWDGTDNKNQPVSSGVYFYRLSVDNFKLEKKMMLLR
jgi:endo-1,4-beta-xylanase